MTLLPGLQERLVEVLQRHDRPLGARPDHHALRPQEILDREPLAQELRVRHDVEFERRSPHSSGSPPAPCRSSPPARWICRPPPCTPRSGLLREDLPEVVRHLQDVLQVRGAVLPGGRGQAQEDDLGRHDRLLEIPRKGDPPLLQIAQVDVLEPRLVDRHLPRVQLLHHRRIRVDAVHRVAPLGQADPGHQPHVPRSDDRHIHPPTPVISSVR